MNHIAGYYLMPHPPIIIPEVGKGEEKKIQATANACHQVAKEIAQIEPETIILISPHGNMFADAIAIAHGERMAGDLGRFNCSQVKMDIPIDREFNEKLASLCKERDIPAVLVEESLLRRFGREFELDHGVMVPLYFINQYVNDYQLVHITYAMLSDVELYQFGMELQQVVKTLGRKAVIIASGDLSHRLSDSGPYDYSPHGKEYDQQVLQHLQQGDVLGVFTLDSCMVEEAGECGLRSIEILLGTMEGYSIHGELLSYEGPFGVGYGVMKFIPKEAGKETLAAIRQHKEQRVADKLRKSNAYVRLARETLNDYYGLPTEEKGNLPEELVGQKHGVFVSLKKYGQLRGCIGTVLPTTNSVAEEIVQNAIGAATRDSRFSPVTKGEVDELDISVDILTEPVPATKDELDPKRYGVIVTKGKLRGLLLPDIEGIDEVEVQLAIACEKGGIDPNDDYQIEKFEVIRYKEGEYHG